MFLVEILAVSVLLYKKSYLPQNICEQVSKTEIQNKF